MRLRLIPDTTGDEYQFMLDILTASFPKEEHRDLPEIERLTRESGTFRPAVLESEDGTLCGIMNHWILDGFIYVEHFAIKEELRSQGLGTQALEAILGAYKKPVALEVEMPAGEKERRRIAFYERSGFRIIPGRYFQPPYRSGDQPLEMLIMGREEEDLRLPSFQEIKKSIYNNVYMTSEHMPYPC